jgi:hypothetical protein
MLPPGLLVHAYTQNVHCSIYSFILLLQGLSETLHFFSIMPSWKRIDSLYYYINISLATKVPELSPRDGACSPSAATIPAESLPGLRRDSRDQIQFILACSEYIYIYIFRSFVYICLFAHGKQIFFWCKALGHIGIVSWSSIYPLYTCVFALFWTDCHDHQAGASKALSCYMHSFINHSWNTEDTIHIYSQERFL